MRETETLQSIYDRLTVQQEMENGSLLTLHYRLQIDHVSTQQGMENDLGRMQKLQLFRSKQRVRARAQGTTVPKKYCKICEEEMSREYVLTDPRRHCLFVCGHSACGTCWSKMSSGPNFLCPWCRYPLRSSTPHKMEGAAARDGVTDAGADAAVS